jgi:hypothetical protein
MVLLLVCAALLFGNCSTTMARKAAALPELSGIVTAVDKYGNVTTDITTALLTETGFALGDVARVRAGNVDDTAPLVDTYSDVNRGEMLVRLQVEGFVELSISYGNLSERGGITTGTSVSIALVEKGGYLAEYEIRHLEKSQERSDYASDAVFANFRMIQGGNIASGMFYRSAHPTLGDARAPYAAALAEEAGIRAVINLADSPEELAQHAPSSPWYESLYTSGNIVTLGMGVDFESPDFPGKLKAGLQFLIAHDGPVLIHCNEGKDRAGIVSALLEAIAGAKLDEITADYMASYENYFGVKKNEPRYTVISRIIVDIFKGMNGGQDVTDANIQKVAETYLTGKAGLTADEITALKNKLKTPIR